jgi:hypothetical protein
MLREEAGMPPFFFDYRDGQGRLDRDDEGAEFPSLKAAYEDATQAAAVDMSLDACCSGQCATQDAFEIRDESGRVLAVSPFAEAQSRAH